MMEQATNTVFPWAWLGWFAAAALALLFIRLWHAAGAVSLRKLEHELGKAKSLIHELRLVNAKLKSRNSTLRSAVHELTTKLEHQMERFKELMDANTIMAGKLSTLTDQLAAEKKLRDEQYQALTKLMAKHGELKP